MIFLVATNAESCSGIVRKKLGLTFVGETREAEVIVTGDIHIAGLDKGVSYCLSAALQ